MKSFLRDRTAKRSRIGVAALVTALLSVTVLLAIGVQPGGASLDEQAPEVDEEQGVPSEDRVIVDAKSERAVTSAGDLQLVLSESNVGTCLHVRSSRSGSAGGCGFDAGDATKSWMIGEILASGGPTAFVAGLAPDGATTVDVTSGADLITADVTDGVWLSLIEDGEEIPARISWYSGGSKLVEITP